MKTAAAERRLTVALPLGAVRVLSGAAATERLWLQEGAPAADLETFLGEAPSPLLRHAHRLVALLVLVGLGLASVLRVDVVVVASGRLAADSPTVVLQPMQLSVVRQIRVRPGDLVRKGEVLAALDATFTQADRAVLQSQQAGARALLGRLTAELDGTGLEAGEGPEARLQGTLLEQRRAQLAAREAEFGRKMAGYAVELRVAEEGRASLVQQIGLARDVEGMRDRLFRSQSGSRLAYVEAQAGRMRTERELQAAVAQVNAVQQAMAAAQAERQAFLDGWRRELLEGLVKARAEAQAVEESLAKANRLAELVELVAPEDGVVVEVAKRSVGSVLNAAEPLITLVPSGAALIAEVAIGSADVGYARPGDAAAVKVDAFPYQRHGALGGRLRAIGADSAFAAGTGAVHRGQVTLEGARLEGMPEGSRLMPGMTVTAEIKVGRRRVISYLLEPVAGALGESMREP